MSILDNRATATHFRKSPARYVAISREFPELYLHMSATGRTSNLEYAWCGTQEQWYTLIGQSEYARDFKLQGA